MEQVINEKEFIKGFNHASLIAEFRPELLKYVVLDANQEHDYTLGFVEGIEQFEQDSQKKQLQELQNLRNIDKGLGREFER